MHYHDNAAIVDHDQTSVEDELRTDCHYERETDHSEDESGHSEHESESY